MRRICRARIRLKLGGTNPASNKINNGHILSVNCLIVFSVADIETLPHAKLVNSHYYGSCKINNTISYVICPHKEAIITPMLTYLEGNKCGDIGKNLNDEKDAYDILHYPTDAENKTQKWLLSYSGFLVVV